MSYNIHHDDRFIQRQSARERQRQDNKAENAPHYITSGVFTQTKDPTCDLGKRAVSFPSCYKVQTQVETFVQCNGGYFLQTEQKNRITKLKLVQLVSRQEG